MGGRNFSIVLVRYSTYKYREVQRAFLAQRSALTSHCVQNNLFEKSVSKLKLTDVQILHSTVE